MKNPLKPSGPRRRLKVGVSPDVQMAARIVASRARRESSEAMAAGLQSAAQYIAKRLRDDFLGDATAEQLKRVKDFEDFSKVFSEDSLEELFYEGDAADYIDWDPDSESEDDLDRYFAVRSEAFEILEKAGDVGK